MDKYKNNEFVEPMDAIILLNNNYEKKGLMKGYIGIVMDNYIKNFGCVVADFSNPITGDCIQPAVEIKKADFRVISSSKEDQKLVRDFKQIFNN